MRALAAVNAALRSAGPHAKEEQTSTNHSSQRQSELACLDPCHIPECPPSLPSVEKTTPLTIRSIGSVHRRRRGGARPASTPSPRHGDVRVAAVIVEHAHGTARTIRGRALGGALDVPPLGLFSTMWENTPGPIKSQSGSTAVVLRL